MMQGFDRNNLCIVMHACLCYLLGLQSSMLCSKQINFIAISVICRGVYFTQADLSGRAV
jgi:hypothetical protein